MSFKITTNRLLRDKLASDMRDGQGFGMLILEYGIRLHYLAETARKPEENGLEDRYEQVLRSLGQCWRQVRQVKDLHFCAVSR